MHGHPLVARLGDSATVQISHLNLLDLARDRFGPARRRSGHVAARRRRRSRSSATRSTRWSRRSRPRRPCCCLTTRTPRQDARRVALAHPHTARLEARSGLTLDRAAAGAETGVDCVSIGALTHSGPAIDLGSAPSRWRRAPSTDDHTRAPDHQCARGQHSLRAAARAAHRGQLAFPRRQSSQSDRVTSLVAP